LPTAEEVSLPADRLDHPRVLPQLAAEMEQMNVDRVGAAVDR
jgi:hypothetical protein